MVEFKRTQAKKVGKFKNLRNLRAKNNDVVASLDICL
jgi:hypothetical protein